MRKTNRPPLALSALLAGALACGAWAASAQGLAEPQGEAILEELKQIRLLLERIEKQDGEAGRQGRRRPVSVKISTAGRPSLGDPDAPVTLVEFADYQCPYCRRFFIDTWPQLVQQYIDTGKVRAVVKDLPLAFHPEARKAAQAAHCAGEQNAFWPMHDSLYRNAGKLDAVMLPEFARILSLDVEAFKACLASGRHLEAIDADAAEAQRARITGTPTFLIGKTTENLVEGALIVGAQRFPVFEGKIKEALDSAKHR